MQRLPRAGLQPFVATEMGKGTIGVTMMRLLRLPVRHMFAPPSMGEGVVAPYLGELSTRLTCRRPTTRMAWAPTGEVVGRLEL